MQHVPIAILFSTKTILLKLKLLNHFLGHFSDNQNVLPHHPIHLNIFVKPFKHLQISLNNTYSREHSFSVLQISMAELGFSCYVGQNIDKSQI